MNAPKPERVRERSPLTDPRSLGGSLMLHAALLLLASAVALSVAAPQGPALPKAIHAEVGPIDNRAPAEGGGGSPGELGGVGRSEMLRVLPAEESIAGSTPTLDPAAESLLSEVLPDLPTPDTTALDLPGPQTSGIGVVPGPGTGGGGGRGGGSGGGIGRGVGPSTEFFGARERAESFAYVIDCSGSMTSHDALGLAKRELLASLDQLPPDARFSVIFYNLKPTVINDSTGRPGLMPATERNREHVRARLSAIPALGGTDHRRALEAAFAERPEVVFFLTDAHQMTSEDAEALRAGSGDSRIHAIEFGDGPDPGTATPIKTLAAGTGGSFRYIDVSRFRRGG